MQKEWDAIVIGTGPAGLAFAATAADLGLDVLAIDDQSTPGGQIYRNIEQQTPQSMKLLGPDYQHGLSLVTAFRASRATYLPNATVWKIEADGRLCYSDNGESTEIRAKRIVIAIGAMERPVPFNGWTLPGVMGVGAVDTLYKNCGMVPEGPVAMVGSGPLMLSVAIHLNELGVEISHFLETQPALASFKALPHLPGALAKPGYLLKGSGMLLKAGRISRHRKRHITGYAAEGNGMIEKLSFRNGGGKETIDTRTLLVHEGIIPRSEFARLLNLEHRWEPVQRYWYPEVDAFGRTSEKNIYIAGDNSYIHGAIAAEKKGVLAAIDIAAGINKLSDLEKQQMSAPVIKALNREKSVRPFIDAVYRPRPNLYAANDQTVICRCEEVTVEQIRQAIIQGMTTPETVKSITRCGMGPCQSRMCSMALSEIIARETGQMVQEMKPVSIRPPVRNLPIGQLSRIDLATETEGG